MLGAGFPPLAAEDVRRVAVPTLLMCGNHSPGVLHRLGDALEELVPAAERVEIEGVSHRMHEEDPGAVNRAILDFLGRHG